MWEIFPFILNLKVKFVAGKWQLEERRQPRTGQWLARAGRGRLLQLKFNAPRLAHPSTVTFTQFLAKMMI